MAPFTRLVPPKSKSCDPWPTLVALRLQGQGRRRRGVAGVRTYALLKSAGDDPQKLGYFSIFLLETYTKMVFSKIFQIMWPKSEEKLNVRVGGFGCL